MTYLRCDGAGVDLTYDHHLMALSRHLACHHPSSCSRSDHEDVRVERLQIMHHLDEFVLIVYWYGRRNEAFSTMSSPSETR